MITGAVNRVEPRAIILDVGNNVEAVLSTSEQSSVEHYRIGQNVKAFVLEVRRSSRGPQILVSRTHKGFLKRLFELEVPEIHSGTVEIKAIAREPARARRSRSRRARRASIPSARPSASAAPASRPSSPSSAARRSTSSRGTTTPASSSRTRCRPPR